MWGPGTREHIYIYILSLFRKGQLFSEPASRVCPGLAGSLAAGERAEGRFRLYGMRGFCGGV